MQEIQRQSSQANTLLRSIPTQTLVAKSVPSAPRIFGVDISPVIHINKSYYIHVNRPKCEYCLPIYVGTAAEQMPTASPPIRRPMHSIPVQ